MEEPKIKEKRSSINNLIKLIESLRSPNGCPWDRKHTPRSMLVYLLEEMYELADAIETDNPEDICEELGDVMFHIFFIARMFEEMEQFSIHDVARVSTEKMIRRHPHVFGEAVVSGAPEVREQWHAIKIEEAKDMDVTGGSFLDSVPHKLPSLMRAYRLIERASRVGVNGGDVASALMKVEEESAEL